MCLDLGKIEGKKNGKVEEVVKKIFHNFALGF